jgi:molybdopterin synthase sulfur carrier subunit
MIEVRLFATLRENREKIVMLEAINVTLASDVLRLLAIDPADVAILLINGKHSKPDDKVKDKDILALFPPVGGG